MGLTYTVIVNTTTPSGETASTIWINPSITSQSRASLMIDDWVLFATDSEITSYSIGSSVLTYIHQEDTPTNPSLGQFWQKTSTNALYIYLNSWVSCLGG